MEQLTDRQLEILRFIARTTEERGFPPTIREIGSEFQIKSTNGVNDHLKALEKKGFLNRGEQQSRAIVPTKAARMQLGMGVAKKIEDRMVEIPVVGRVAAGAPILAAENIEDHVQIDSYLLPESGREVFALRVKGESMIGDGIHDGDYLFVRKQAAARNGEIVVVMIEDEATCKRIFFEGDRIRLQPSNPAMQPFYVAKADFRQTMVLGAVVGVYRKMPT